MPFAGGGNLADLVAAAAGEVPQRPALVYEGRRITWSELDAAVTTAASALAASGLAPGDRVALLLGNRPEFVVAYFATLRAGLVAVPLNTGYTEPEVSALLTESGAALVVAEPGTVAVARGAAAALDVPVVAVGGGVGVRDWAELVAGAPAAPFAPAAGGEDLAVLLFTSGTSGRPRGAMLSHRALLANLDQCLALRPSPITSDDVVLLVLPLFHVFALNGVLGLVARTGATAVLADRFDPEETLALVGREAVTSIPAAPPLYVAWADRPRLREELAGVRVLVSGAAPLPPVVFEQYATALGRPVHEGYGLTEAAPGVTTTLASPVPKPGSVGRPLPGVELRLADEDGAPVVDGDPGEIWLRGPNLFSGYWPDGADGPDEEGWFATGDVAYADADGDLFLVDRRKELILVSGFNVYPREVEAVLEGHPGVREAAVVGVPHPQTGEAVQAFVVPEEGSDLRAEELVAYCEARLARFKRPTIVRVVASLPHSATGKVTKAALRGEVLVGRP